MYYLVDLQRRRILAWRETLVELKEFMLKHDIGESEHVKIVRDI